jgi:DNA repair exonuclease SbcCD ATPase subunit
MQLIDLVLQGVRRFIQSQRIPFKPGLNIVFGGTESGKTTLYDCILELMFPNRIADGKQTWQSWSGTDQSRAGLTLKNNE